MSNLQHSQILEDAQSDFDQMLKAGKFADCEALIDGLNETGFKNEAAHLLRMLVEFRGAKVAAINDRFMDSLDATDAGEGESLRDQADRMGTSLL